MRLESVAGFSIFDKVDERTKEHGIRACTLWGADWDNETTPKLHIRANETLEAGTHKLNSTYHIGWWDTAGGNDTASPELAVVSHVRSLAL